MFAVFRLKLGFNLGRPYKALSSKTSSLDNSEETFTKLKIERILIIIITILTTSISYLKLNFNCI